MARLVEITNLCQAFHCLPAEGGLLDQDFILMQAMAVVLPEINKAQERAQKKLMDEEQGKARRAAKH